MFGKLWVSTFCSQAEFVVKADDDMYIDLFATYTLTRLLHCFIKIVFKTNYLALLDLKLTADKVFFLLQLLMVFRYLKKEIISKIDIKCVTAP